MALLTRPLRASLDLREKSNNPEQMVQIKVAMATCGIAAGAKEVMSYFIEALDRERVDALVTQTGITTVFYPKNKKDLLVFHRSGLKDFGVWRHTVG